MIKVKYVLAKVRQYLVFAQNSQNLFRVDHFVYVVVSILAERGFRGVEPPVDVGGDSGGV